LRPPSRSGYCPLLSPAEAGYHILIHLLSQHWSAGL